MRHGNDASDGPCVIAGDFINDRVQDIARRTAHPNKTPPKATKSPTAIAFNEDPGVFVGFIIPTDLRSMFWKPIMNELDM